MNNISDRIIDTQGPTGTYSSGADSKLFYIDVNGNRLNYILQGIETSTDVKLENNKLIKVSEPVTSISLNFTKNVKNSQLIFETGELSDVTVNIESGMYLNREFDFDSYKVYFISVSDGVILWNELIEWA